MQDHPGPTHALAPAMHTREAEDKHTVRICMHARNPHPTRSSTQHPDTLHSHHIYRSFKLFLLQRLDRVRVPMRALGRLAAQPPRPSHMTPPPVHSLLSPHRPHTRPYATHLTGICVHRCLRAPLRLGHLTAVSAGALHIPLPPHLSRKSPGFGSLALSLARSIVRSLSLPPSLARPPLSRALCSANRQRAPPCGRMRNTSHCNTVGGKLRTAPSTDPRPSAPPHS